jgi:hypothetical protein
MRFLGIGLLVALSASAISAGSAMAAKDPYTVNTLAQFAHCPYENEEVTDCFFGRTAGGSAGGYFQYGHVFVALKKPIVIQGGLKGEVPNAEVEPPTGGAKLLESPEEPISKGMKVITPQIQNEAEWPEALKQSFKEALKNKEAKAYAVVEEAGTECITVPGCVNTLSLLSEIDDPPAFKLALKVRVVNPWLEKLGGGPCLIGSDEHPVKQNLVTSGAGRPGVVRFNSEFTVAGILGSALTDAGWHVSKEQGANGCGGEYEAYVNKALNIALEVEDVKGLERVHKTGITYLTGNLYDGLREAMQIEHENGNPELP